MAWVNAGKFLFQSISNITAKFSFLKDKYYNNHKCLYSIYFMTDTFLGTLHVFINLTFTISIYRCCYWPSQRYREVMQLVQGHTAYKWKSWDLNPGSLATESWLLTTSCSCTRNLQWLFIFHSIRAGHSSIFTIWL